MWGQKWGHQRPSKANFPKFPNYMTWLGHPYFYSELLDNLATTRFLLIYLCLYNSILLGRVKLRGKKLATVNQYSLTLFDLPVTSQVKNKVNMIVSCTVRRDLSSAVWIFKLRLLLLKIRGGAPLGPPSGPVTRQTPSGRGLTSKTFEL